MDAKPVFLYHGSATSGIEVLEPRRRRVPGTDMDAPSAVYASDDAAFAAGFGFSWGSNEGGIWHGYTTNDEGGLVVCMMVSTTQQHKLEQPVSVYKVSSDSFELMPHVPPCGRNYRSWVAVRCLAEESFTSVTAAIEHYGGIVKVIDE